MTKKELIEQLSDVPDDTLIVLQRDPEGNGYGVVAGVDAECCWCEEDHEVMSPGDGLPGCAVVYPLY